MLHFSGCLQDREGCPHVQETLGRNGSSACVSIAQYPSGMLVLISSAQ